TAPTTPQPSQPSPSPGGWGQGAGSGYSPAGSAGLAGSAGPAGSAGGPEGRAPDFSSWYNQSPRSGAPSPPASGSGYPPPAGYAPAAWSGQASQQQQPPWSGAEYAPSRPRRSGFGWKAAVAALAIIGAAAGAGTVVLLHQGHSGSPQGQ